MNISSPRSRLIAAALAFIVGMLGVHRFYVGKIGTGIAQLLLTISWFGAIVSGIWVLIDFILILVGEFKDKEGRKLDEWDPSGNLLKGKK